MSLMRSAGICHIDTMRRLLPLVLLFACSPKAIPGTQAYMSFERGRDVWKAPVPSNDLIKADGHIETNSFPLPGDNAFVKSMLDVIAKDARGFSTAAPIFFRFTGALGELDEAAILLVSVDAHAPDYGTKYAYSAAFVDGGPFGTPNMLVILPEQGHPLRPATTYAAIVLRALKDENGDLLGVPLQMSQLAFNVRPAGMSAKAFDSYTEALRVIDQKLGIHSSAIAALTVFTTDDVTGVLQKGRERLLAEPTPQPEAPLQHMFTYHDYCVFHATVQVPVLQRGTPPFFDGGGDWVLDDDGVPVVQGHERANLFVTIPRSPLPANGFPAVVYTRQGGAGAIPLADRGVRASSSAAAIPGSGPAQELAKVGYAGVSLDGPNVGLRNPSGADEQILLFNFFNPVAMRDNMRESAVELDLLASMLDDLRIDASACPDGPGNGARLDTAKLVLMGHSTGAWITPIAAAFEPRFKNVIMSGAGASWIENILWKKSPLDVKLFATGILQYDETHELTAYDPAVLLAQWAADPADPQQYAPHLIEQPPEAPRNVLVFQSLDDTYIMPPIADALNESAGVELVDFPAQGNHGDVTAVLARHPKDPYEDGHEIMFQREEPKYQYRCFLRTLRDEGVPRVPEGIASPAVCP